MNIPRRFSARRSFQVAAILVVVAVVSALSSAGVRAAMRDTPVSGWVPKLAKLALIPVSGFMQGPIAGQEDARKVPGAQAKPGAPEQAPAGDGMVSLLVKTAPGLSEADVETLVARAGANKGRGIGRLRLQVVRVPEAALNGVMNRFKADPDVERVEIDQRRQIAQDVVPAAPPSDPSHAGQWALETIRWNAAWASITPAGAARIAVLDTGVSPAAGEINVADGWSAFGTDPKSDANGHGTWVASIAAAVGNNGKGVAGVSFANTSVLPVQVLDANGQGQDSDIISGVLWAVENNADVILMAFSNPGYSQALQDAIDLAWANGIVIVAAAGNEASSTPTFPAGDSKVVGVAATDQADALWSQSNFGKAAFLAAPGVGISGVRPDGSILSTSGTSASSALVAGAAALLKVADPSLTNGVIVGRLARNADVAGTQEQTGNGRLNVERALADASLEEVVPVGAPPEGDGGPFVGPYRIAATNRTLEYTRSGSGTGTVTFERINVGGGAENPDNGSPLCSANGSTVTATCTGTGTFRFKSNDTYRITATPSSGSTFGGWSGQLGSLSATTCGGTMNPCPSASGSISLSVDSKITATFNSNATTTTTVTLLTGTNPSTYGDPITFRASVSQAPGSVGSVTFRSGSAVLCSAVPLNASAATCSPSLQVGSHSVIAEYSGGTGFGASTSVALPQAVNVKALTVSGVTASSKAYDGNTTATLTGTAALNGIVGSDTVTLIGSAVASFNNAAVGTAKPVAVSGYSLAGAAASNYSLTPPALTADITPKSVTGNFTADNREYDGTTAATISARSVSGKVGSDAVELTDGTASFADKSVANGKTVTLTGATLSGADAGNYTLASVATAMANITAKSVTGSFTAGDKEYDGTTAATVSARSLTGKVGSDAVELTDGTASFADKSVANGKTVTLTGATLSGADAGNYTLASVATAMANITAKSVTGSFTAGDKEYDGTTAATVSARSLTGKVGSDAVELTDGTASFADKSVANGKTVTLTGATLSGADAGNYTLASVATAMANITAKSVTGSFTAGDKEYDGTTAATVSARSLTGKVGSDAVELTDGTASFADKSVANGKTVTLTGATLSGADAGNYTLASIATATANITAKSVTGSFTAQSKVYDGSPSAVVVSQTVAGAIVGDAVELTGGTATFDNKNVGTGKTVTLNGATLSGTDAGNYSLTSVATTTADVTPASLTPAVTVNNKTYDGTAAATISTRDFAAPSIVVVEEEVALDGGTAIFADANAGTAKQVTISSLALAGSDAGNYTLSSTSATTTADITKANPTVVVTPYSVTFDGQPHTATGTASGVGSVDLSSLLNLAATTHTNAGTYTADAWTFAGNENYEAANGTVDNAIAKAAATVLVAPYSVTFDGQPHTATGTASGVAGVDLSSLLNLAATTHTNAGTYAGDAWTFAGNENYEAANGTVDNAIAKAAATVVVAPYSVTFDGQPHTATGTASGVAGADLSSLLNLAATIHTNAGTYAGDAWTFAGNENYEAANGTVDNAIAKAAATVVVAPYSVTFDGQPHTATGTASGVAGADLSSLLNLAATIHTNAGTYAGDAWTFAGNENYEAANGTVDNAIAKAAATVVVAPYSVTFDGQPHTATGTASGVGSVDLSSLLNLAATTHTNAGTYAADAWTFAGNENYEAASGTVDNAITKRAVTITADAKSKIYGEVDPALTYQMTAGSLVTGDDFTGGLLRVTGESVGTYAIGQGAVALSTNYDLTFAGADLTITQRAVTITADAKSKIYGEVDPALTYQITAGSLVTGDDFTGGLLRVTGESVGTYAIGQGAVALSTNYDLTFAGADLAITKRAVTITAAAQTKVYGEVDPALTYAISSGTLGFSDAFTGALTRVAGEGVGSYAIQQGTVALDGNYDLTFAGADLAITKRAVTITAAAQTKVYGEVDPALTYAISSGTLGFSDAFTGALTRVAGEGVGSYAIQQGTVALDGNYDLTFAGADLAITKRAVTITAAAQTKVYGEADPALTYAISSGTLGFSDAFTGALTRVAGEGVGSYAIQQGTVALDGNYDLTFAGADLAITKRAVTITAAAQTKVYGEADPALTYAISSGTLGFSDAFTGALTRVAGEGVGSYAIQQGTVALDGNYDLTFAGADLAITKRAVTITAAAQTKVYGEADPALTYAISSGTLGFSDAFTGALTRVAGEGVGSYAIQQGTVALDGNYDLTFAGADLAITKRAVTITAAAQTKVYGEVDPALTYAISSGTLGFSDAFTGALTRVAGEGVGSYAIQQGTVALDGNYDLTFAGADLAITKRAVTITAAAQTKVYGEVDPALTYAISSGTLGFSDAFTGALTRVAGEGVGSYAIQQGTVALDGNYDLTFAGADLAITKRAVTITAAAQTKVYGEADPALTYQITAGSLVTGDDFTGGLLRATGESVGTYAIGQGAVALSTNYDLTFAGADLTITKRAASVVANAQSKTYGDDNPVLTAVVTGTVNGDSLAYELATPATQFSAVGPHAITVTLGANGNYEVTPTNALLTIGKAAATVVADAKSKTYGDGNPELTAVVTGALNGDVLNYSLATPATQFSAVGPHAITVTLGANGNYEVTPTNALLTIGKAAATVVADAKSKTYGDGNPELTAVVTGALNGDVLNYSLATPATQFSAVGPHEITVTLGANGNYEVTPTNALLTIGKAAATVVADAKSKTYGDGNPELTAVVTGALNGDVLNYSLATPATQFSAVGPHAITVTLGANGNYEVTPTDALLTIGKAPATVLADAKSKTYGDGNPELTAVVTGALNGDVLNYSLATPATQFSAVGPHAITVTLGANGNYEVTPTNALLTIGKAAATVVANAQSKTYGDDNPVLTAVVTGTVNGDSLAYELATVAEKFSAVGPHAITVTLGANGNYEVTPTDALLTIGKAAATVVADAKSKTYGDVNPELTAVVTGALNGDVLNYSLATPATQFSAVGTHAITVTLGANGNYQVSTTDALLTIAARSISGAFTAANKVYDGGISATVTTRSLVGTVNSDDVELTGGTAAFDNKNVGFGKTVTLTGAALGGAAAGNYTLSSVATVTTNITARPLAVTATGVNKPYDGNTTTTVTFADDRVAGDVLTIASTPAFNNKNVGNGKPVNVSSIVLSGADAGNYTPNDTTTASANITPRPLVVSATGINKVYDGTTTATVNLGDNRVAGDVLVTAYAGAAFANNQAGTAKVVNVSGITTTGLDAGNYTANTATTTTADITRRPVKIAAEAKSKQFGVADPALTYQLTLGTLVAGDSFSGSLTRTVGEAVGSYPILVGSVSAGPNYEVTYVGANLTIGAWTATGFYSPIAVGSSFINAPGASAPAVTGSTLWNVSKGGSTVPLKFDIFRDGQSMPESTNTADVKTFVAQQLSSCSVGVNDTIEEDPAALTLGTGLKYDGEQFHQNWKTPTVKSDTCFRVTVTLQDNTTIHTFLKLRK